MTKATIAGGAFATALVLLAVVAGYRVFEPRGDLPAPTPPAVTQSAALPATAAAHPGFLYGRVTTRGGATYEGRLRWGGDQEAFWGDYLNGVKEENPWVAQLPARKRAGERRPIEIFGIEIPNTGRKTEIRRPFLARFGDVRRIEAQGVDVRVTLKSGTVFDLNRSDASDFDDGVRVWDGKKGAVDLDSLWLRTIELLPTPPLAAAPSRLHGTVRTRHGDFTGFLQWDREECVGTDELDGQTDDGKVSLRFDTIRSIARRSRDSSVVTLHDGREVVLSGTREVGHGNRGIYLDDARYGRVLIPWDAFERVDFTPGGSGPAYDAFPPGRPLTGSVTDRAGRRLAGRLVYDLDESETTETLDAPSEGVDYTIPFGLIATIVPRGREKEIPARVTLHNGEELPLERTGDLGDQNAGMLIFVDGNPSPEYVLWADVERIDLDRPPEMYPRLR